MHYYQFRIGDYRKDTTHLSRLEHSIYRDLIDWYYLEEKPIPKETQWVIRRLRLVTQGETQALQNVLSDFFEQGDDGWHHAKIDAEINHYKTICGKNKSNGNNGGRPKKNPVGYESEPSRNPNHKPLTINHKPDRLSNDSLSPTPPEKKSKPDQEKKPEKKQIELPDWLPADVWAAWIEYRAKMRKPMTDHAQKLSIRELEKLRISGDDPAEIINQSIMRGWTGLFSVKKDFAPAEHKKPTYSDTIMGAMNIAQNNLRGIKP